MTDSKQSGEMKAEKNKREEYSEIYRIYFPRLVRFSQTYLPSPEDAENVVQDIFLYLWEHPELLASLKNRNAFLFTIVKNRCIDQLRNRIHLQKLSAVDEKELKFKLYSLQSFEENNLSETEIESIIQNAIDSLPERCREIFILSRLKGLKHKQIAEQLQITTNTIEGQISIALRKLREKLKNHLPILVFLM
ncbi:MAG: RNA polymerase sigma-70 factor [Tannerellaceae bacterium]|nr:RNA polymerase sigma-70 factor [Tannerellaceae bacterium]